MIPTRVLTSLVLPLLVAAAGAQTKRTAPITAPQIAVIGASLSAGAPLKNFAQGLKPEYRTETIGLGKVLAKLYGRDEVLDTSNLWFFQNAEGAGTVQIGALKNHDLKLVIAIDFLFWFGYGAGKSGERPKSSEVEDWRLTKQKRGFELVDQLRAETDATIVLGDYPDMSDANPLMLPRKAIPTYATLKELNKRARAFAAERDDVLLYPLAEVVGTIREDGATVTVDGKKQVLDRHDLMQLDKLHPTRLGMAVLTEKLVNWLIAKLPADDPARPVPQTFDHLLEVTGGDKVLATVLEHG